MTVLALWILRLVLVTAAIPPFLIIVVSGSIVVGTVIVAVVGKALVEIPLWNPVFDHVLLFWRNERLQRFSLLCDIAFQLKWWS